MKKVIGALGRWKLRRLKSGIRRDFGVLDRILPKHKKQ